MRHPLAIVCLFVGLLALAFFVTTRNATAQFQAGGPRYEYLLLVLDADKPVALTADQRIEIQPPARLLSGRIDDPGVSNQQYSLRTIEERHADVGALNILGEQGWEVVTTLPYDKTTAVLMKRRAG